MENRERSRDHDRPRGPRVPGVALVRTDDDRIRGLARPHSVLELRGNVRLHIRCFRRPRHTERQTRRSGYLPWGFFDGSHGTKIVLQRSSDGGLSWTPIISLSHSPNSQNQGATVAVGPGGEVYVAWEDFHKDQILFTRSLDCGQTFDVEQGIASIVPVPEPLPGSAYRLDSFPRMAVSQTTGSIFMTWADYRSGDADVLLARSTDHGLSWSPPSRVNDVTTNHQIFPAMTTFRGRVDVSFYDSRNDPGGKLLDIYYAQSNDDGLTFLPNVRVTDAAFDPNLGVTGGGAAFLGDYNGIASNAAGAHPIWADNRNVSPSALRDQDIYTATIS